MRFTLCVVAVLRLATIGSVSGFTARSFSVSSPGLATSHTATPRSFSSLAIATATVGEDSTELSAKEQKKQERKQLIRQEGGRFAFDTKYGALNPFAIFYGLTAILLGIPWYIALTLCQVFYFLTGNKIDKQVSEFSFLYLPLMPLSPKFAHALALNVQRARIYTSVETASNIYHPNLGNHFDEINRLLPKESEQGNPKKILQEVRISPQLQAACLSRPLSLQILSVPLQQTACHVCRQPLLLG